MPTADIFLIPLPPYVFPLAASYVTVSIPLLRCFYIIFGRRICVPLTEGMHNVSYLLKWKLFLGPYIYIDFAELSFEHTGREAGEEKKKHYLLSLNSSAVPQCRGNCNRSVTLQKCLFTWQKNHPSCGSVVYSVYIH